MEQDIQELIIQYKKIALQLFDYGSDKNLLSKSYDPKFTIKLDKEMKKILKKVFSYEKGIEKFSVLLNDENWELRRLVAAILYPKYKEKCDKTLVDCLKLEKNSIGQQYYLRDLRNKKPSLLEHFKKLYNDKNLDY